MVKALDISNVEHMELWEEVSELVARTIAESKMEWE